jgi:hypothetical protein
MERFRSNLTKSKIKIIFSAGDGAGDKCKMQGIKKTIPCIFKNLIIKCLTQQMKGMQGMQGMFSGLYTCARVKKIPFYALIHVISY